MSIEFDAHLTSIFFLLLNENYFHRIDMNGIFFLLTPTNKRYPKMWHQKYDKNVCINFFIESLCFAKYTNALSANNEHDNGHCNVKEDRINCCKWSPAECNFSCKRESKIRNENKAFCVLTVSVLHTAKRDQDDRHINLPGADRVIGITASARNSTSKSLWSR